MLFWIIFQMDKNSNYLAISADRLEEVIRPETREKFDRGWQDWLEDPDLEEEYSKRTTGIFKVEYEGTLMITLYSKCYYADAVKANVNAKGMEKGKNELSWLRFQLALAGETYMGCNRGFRMHKGCMMTSSSSGWQRTATRVGGV